MEATYREHSAPIAQQLRRRPERFNFFQYVRLVEGFNYFAAEQGLEELRHPVGYSWPCDMEVISFAAKQSYQFPYTQITDHRMINYTSRIKVSFMGLTGISGILPSSYTRMVIRQNQLNNHAIDEFFNAINHRAISFYYRAWSQYRICVSYERARRLKKRSDLFTRILDCLSGFGMPALQNRLSMPQDAVLHYTGFFCQNPHNAINLCYMLNSYFNVDVDMFQFKGDWETIIETEQTRLPALGSGSKGQYNVLSQNASLGSRIWSSQNHFRLKIGPLSYKQFESFLPTGDCIKALVELTRTYVGSQFSFELQLDLKPEQIPICCLRKHSPPRLSWETWLDSEGLRKKGVPHDDQAVVLRNSIMDL